MSSVKNPYCYPYPRPCVTVDIVCCRYVTALEILLIGRKQPPFAHCWALPGGFIEIDEDLQQAARRELFEETHLVPYFLEQFYTFGSVDRDPRHRTITVAYLALINSKQIAQSGDDAEDFTWRAVTQLPALAFDHLVIIEKALHTIQHWQQLGIWPT